MPEIFRDPVWQFVGAMLALIAIGVAVISYLLQRRKKSLSFKTISYYSLLTTDEEIRNELQIFYKGELVKAVQLLTLEVINNGNQPIPSSDYEKPLSFIFREEAQILSAEIISMNPSNLDVKLSIKKNKLLIEPVLLNSKDSFTLKAFINDHKRVVKPDARIIGISAVKPFKENIPNIFKSEFVISIFLLSCSLMLLVWIIFIVIFFLALSESYNVAAIPNS